MTSRPEWYRCGTCAWFVVREASRGHLMGEPMLYEKPCCRAGSDCVSAHDFCPEWTDAKTHWESVRADKPAWVEEADDADA